MLGLVTTNDVEAAADDDYNAWYDNVGEDDDVDDDDDYDVVVDDDDDDDYQLSISAVSRLASLFSNEHSLSLNEYLPHGINW